MLKSFKRFLSDLAVGQKDQVRFEDNDYRLAAAALLIHAAMIDGAMSDAERNRLIGALMLRFGLDDAAAQELVAEAIEPSSKRSTSIASPACSIARSTKPAASSSSK